MSTPSSQLLPVLPWEITDSIIDHLHSDFRTLGVCGMVCSEWLVRSRHHIFSTVQLWPWRVRNFIELTLSKTCTFSRYIRRIEMDDSRIRPNSVVSENISFCDAMSFSQLSRLYGVEAIQVRHVDWTALSPIEQTQLRERLANFKHLKQLEFDDVVFHDLREVVRIINSFPLMNHLIANVTFMKYMEHAIASAITLRLPETLQTVELGTDDGIPVVLSCISAAENEPHLQRLNLRQVKADHLPAIHKTVRKVGRNLRHLLIDFHEAGWQGVAEEEISRAFKFSLLTQLRSLRFEGMRLSKEPRSSVIASILPHLLSRLESPFLDSIELCFSLDLDPDLDSDFEILNWQYLSRVLMDLHFFGLRRVGIQFTHVGTVANSTHIAEWVRRMLRDLDARGILDVQVLTKTDDAHCELASLSCPSKLWE